MQDQIIKTAELLDTSKYAIALTGAGISTESGIQDYRGPSGVWTLNPQAEREAYKSYDKFVENPAKWWNDILSPADDTFLSGNLTKAEPNAGHFILAEMERMDIVKCVITQNVDSLHEKAGTEKIIEYHGSMSKLRCLSCGNRYNKDALDLEKFKNEGKLPPRCPACNGVMKIDGVFFGEPIPSDVLSRSIEEVEKCDMMLICGTSAVVYPFASLPRLAKERKNATIVEINAEPTPLTYDGVSDFLIQGNLGEILPRIFEELKKLRD